MARREACLVDVYDTLLSCDFTDLRSGLPTLAGVSPDAWDDAYSQLGAAFSLGQLTKSEGFGRILTTCGAEPRPDLVRALVARDRELLLASARLYEDAIPFLEALRARGVRIAIVSNCSEHTRDMLENLGVAERADALVLSCEVGAAKPEPEIFRYALAQLGVTARSAMFVDDQAAYCAAGAALGIDSVQIIRGEPDGNRQAEGTRVVRSLTEAEALLWA